MRERDKATVADDGALMRRIPWWVSMPVVLGTGLAIAWAERRRALRTRVEPDVPHGARNLAIAAAGAVVLQLAERPVVNPLAALVVRRRLGLLQQLRLPRGIETLVAMALMDYTLYVWHVLAHQIPILWRAHAVHHIDRDLDASTAVRFHFAELAASVPWRAGQIVLIGVSPRNLSIWQTALLVSILFHHSNLDLSPAVDRVVARVLVTPRMHGIHHSTRVEEVNSNWSSGLSIWDMLHRTFRHDVPQEQVTIGVPGFDGEPDTRLQTMLALPFTRDERLVPPGQA